ncbi:DHA2 family efflux MFS transporter permease subunit [Aneurinibacillus terranovensis]|uniref:DHA2 family efflux MFS transporter permease subunit n=1 Tax=Aneurinibacillus terranovensis TaxID=278991 RepID=UPI0003F7185A|nr:DHA2 family efflux MFS transporter permease subunit [Aneurinibacillus terranovensis]
MGKWLILIPIILGLSMDLLDMTIIEVALPNIMIEFGSDIDLTQYIITAYMITIGVFEPITAYWADTRGMKKVYIISLLIFTLSSIFCALSWNIDTLIVFRILQAVGGGMIMPVALSIIEKSFNKEELPLAMGLMGLPLLIAPAIGPTLGGYLVERLNWRWIFWINVPLGLLAVSLSYVLLREFETVKKKLDVWGFILSAIGFGSLLLALSNGASDGWTSASIIFLFFLSGISLLSFFLLEACTSDPLLDLQIFKSRIYSASIGVTFFFMIALYGSLYLVPLFMQELRGLGAIETGMLLIYEAIGAMLFLPISSVLLPRLGGPVLTITGIVIMTIGSYFLVDLQVNTDIEEVKRNLLIIGMGLGLGIMPSITLAYSSLPENLVNQGSAFLNLIRQFGSALGVAILNSVIQQRMPIYYHQLSDSITPGSNAEMYLRQLASYFQSIGHASEQSYQLGMAVILKQIQTTASISAFQNAFFISLIFGLLAIIPALFLYRKNQFHVRVHVDSGLLSSDQVVENPNDAL